MAESRIFISYRRDDSAGFARAIGDALGQRFGRDRIWLDVDDIGAGQAFDAEIERAVGAASVLLVLIGRRWAGPVEGSALRRIDDPQDFVRHEVETGLARGMALIPLLLDGAAMPTEHELPESLSALARRQALPIDNARFDADIARLEAVLRKALAQRIEPDGSWRRLLLIGGVAIALLAGGGYGWRRSQARPPVNGNWTAAVSYDWPNANYIERFAFDGDGPELFGKASFLRADRAIVDGRVDTDGNLVFTIRTQEQVGSGDAREVTHRYRGRLQGDEIRFTMQTEGGYSPHVPVDFVARRSR